MSLPSANVEEMRAKFKGGGGAQFWAYISSQNETAQYVNKWIVKLGQKDGNWTGFISSDDPTKILKTPNLSGIFNVRVIASGPLFKEKQLTNLPDSKPDIGCNSNCHAMVGMVATEDGTDAHYWTVWDAFCD
jgi:hypothetical protein